MGIGHKLYALLSGRLSAEHREERLEKDPAKELRKEAKQELASNGDTHQLVQEDLVLLDDFRASVNAQFDTLTRGREDLMRAYNLIVQFMRARQQPSNAVSLNNERHATLQARFHTQFRYALRMDDKETDAGPAHAYGHEISIVGLQNQLMSLAAKQRDALTAILDVWSHHPLFDRHELRPVRERIKAKRDAWKALSELAHDLTVPYPLKQSERMLEIIAGYRLNMEVPLSERYVNVEKDAPGDRVIIADYKAHVDKLRAIADKSFDTLRRDVENADASLFGWKTA